MLVIGGMRLNVIQVQQRKKLLKEVVNINVHICVQIDMEIKYLTEHKQEHINLKVYSVNGKYLIQIIDVKE